MDAYSTYSSTDTSATWDSWVSVTDCTFTAGSSNSAVWYTWISGTTSTNATVMDSGVWRTYWVPAYEETRTEKRQRGRRERKEERLRKLEHKRRLAEQAKLEKERDKAEEKAKQLLMDLIGEDELKLYEETGRLLVKGRKYDYIIQKEGFVKRVEKDKIVDLCIHLENKTRYPATDNVIALKLLAETNEKKFNELANRHGEHPRPAELPRCATG